MRSCGSRRPVRSWRGCVPPVPRVRLPPSGSVTRSLSVPPGRFVQWTSTATESQTPEELIGANPQPTLDSILQAGGPAGAEKGNPAETEDAQKEGDEIIHNLPPGQEKEGVPSPASAETIEEEGAAIEGSNKQVVKERPGTDNIEDSSNGEDVTPDDE